MKLAVEFQVCDHAKSANTPEEIRSVANSSFTAELKRYQDFMNSGDLNAQSSKGDVPPPEEWMNQADASAQAVTSYSGPPQAQYYAYRQNLAYHKEVVVLAGPTYFVQGSPEYIYVTRNIQVQNQNITQVVTANPALSKSTASWSKIPNRPVVVPPRSLAILQRPTVANSPAKPITPPQGMNSAGDKGKQSLNSNRPPQNLKGGAKSQAAPKKGRRKK